MKQPDLSVAIIFKNEIRCLERCLKSIQPLKERISVEIVMADTGSDDSSLEIAKKYADVVFDFPWIDDFSAARNAVLDRCTGHWCLILDADEWLGENIDELVVMLHRHHAIKLDSVAIPVRSYTVPSKRRFQEVCLPRLLRMEAEPRYHGAIHEIPVFLNGNGKEGVLSKTILYHDGYVMLNDGSESGKAKVARNRKLLYKELEKSPGDLRRLLELLDISADDPRREELLHRAAALVEDKQDGWDTYGPIIIAHPAWEMDMPEASKWAEKARQWFPDSYYTTVDLNYADMIRSYQRGDWKQTARFGEAYLRACEILKKDTGESSIFISPLRHSSENAQYEAHLLLADSYRQLGEFALSHKHLCCISWRERDSREIGNAINIIARLYAYSNEDLSQVTKDLWQGICTAGPDGDATKERKETFIRVGATVFESAQEGKNRPAWDVFLPLRGACILGDTAAIMHCKTKEDAENIVKTLDESQLPKLAQNYVRHLDAMSAPALSVAIIFKDEIRCIERCLQSIQPLKDFISMETVMADTGSTDGSRIIADKYADIVFDFPWVNDFSAARNAVLDRCSGEWVLVLDCDEWLDENVDELTDFVRRDGGGAPGAALVVRNYIDREFRNYTDFYNARLLRLSLQPRYEGTIHEKPVFPHNVSRSWMLPKTILHHDGYVELYSSKTGQKKRERNTELIREELRQSPDDLRVLTQFFDSASDAPDCEEKVYHSVQLVEQRQGEWQSYGAIIYRNAVMFALNHGMKEQARRWAKDAEKSFPDSLFTRIDINFQILRVDASEDAFRDVIRRSRIYLEAKELLQRSEDAKTELCRGTLTFGTGQYHKDVHLLSAFAWLNLDNTEETLAHLHQLDITGLLGYQIPLMVSLLKELYVKQGYDSSILLRELWDKCCTGTDQEAKACRNSLISAAPDSKEPNESQRSAWHIFLPLRGKCILGDAAALLESRTQEDADAVLETIEDLTALPPKAFIRALKLGAAFPLPDKPLTIELADTMAAMLATDIPFLCEAATFSAVAFESDADLIWARSLVLAALKCNDWENDAEPQALLHAFVRVESVFLARCYSPYALQMPEYLTPMQRFAVHLVNAFTVLAPQAISPEFQPSEQLDIRGALAQLKAAVIAVPTQKAVVDIVIDLLSSKI